MRISFKIGLLTLLVLFLSVPLPARDMERTEKNIPAEKNIKNVKLEADIGLARLHIEPQDGGDIFAGKAYYDADKFRVDMEYETHGDKVDIFLYSEQARRKLNLDSDDNDWRVVLSRDYNWDIDLEVGFAECLIDLSGIPISDLSIDIGASECDLEFNQPNPIVMEMLDIDAGAGELKIEGLGNANFEDMRFDGGAGDFLLNFEGEFEGFRKVRIDIGVGAVELEIPGDLPVRIETNDSWLNSINFKGARLIEVENGVYETRDYDLANRGLEIDLDLGIGEAEISWVR